MKPHKEPNLTQGPSPPPKTLYSFSYPTDNKSLHTPQHTKKETSFLCERCMKKEFLNHQMNVSLWQVNEPSNSCKKRIQMDLIQASLAFRQRMQQTGPITKATFSIPYPLNSCSQSKLVKQRT